MSDRSSANAAQAEHWNSDEVSRWVTEQDRYDGMLAPFATALAAATELAVDANVLDIGCGTGLTTCDAARVATKGRAHGIDISQAMVEGARVRATAAGTTNASFAVGDAQTEKFAGDVDVVISRFGVMFFEDPTAAFANIRTALTPGGRIVFVCWQELLANAWMAVPGMAAARVVPLPDVGAPDAPGAFAFGDQDRVRGVLDGAGFSAVTIEPMTASVLLGGGGTLDDAIAFLRSTGIARTLFAGVPEATVDRAMQEVATDLEPFRADDGFRLDGAAWIVSAQNR